MLRFVPLITALALAACASAGTKYNEASAASVRPGMTKAEVVAMLGPPNAVSTGTDGREVLVWTYSSANGFTGQMNARSVAFLFDAGGRVMKAAGRAQLDGRTGR